MNKENWGKFLSEIIKSSINNFDMIGDNLRVQCIKYFEQLETNRDDAIEYLRYALDEEKETPSKYNDWRLDLLEMIGRSEQDEADNGR